MEAIITGLATGITTLLGLPFVLWAVIYLLNRIDSRIEASNAVLRSEIREASARVSEVEREQARLEGYNTAMSEMIRQQSHTHDSSGGD